MTSSIPSLPRQGGFTFKQFFIGHDRCGMKVSTDGVLLGAWTPLPTSLPAKILDIGTGSGLLAIMLAQRLAQCDQPFSIDAIDIDSQAVAQAKENVANSPWREQVQVWQQDLLTWDNPADNLYSLIICNPPYFQQGKDFRDQTRELARNSASLDHHALLSKVATLIRDHGYFCVVLPWNESLRFEEYAARENWFLQRRCVVAERENRAPHRVLMCWCRDRQTLEQQRLIMRDSQGSYSESFCALTQDFYLER